MKSLIYSVLFFFLSFTATAGYKAGDKAADFSLKNIDGKMISMSEMKEAKGFIVIFTCNHCPFAKAYEDRIIALNNTYAAKGFPVIAINPNDVTREPDDSYENMIIRAKEKNFTFPYLYDESQQVASQYGATRTPHVYIVVKEGSDFVVRYIGAIDNNADDPAKADIKYVEDALAALMSGKTVPTAETKAIGCTIKWKQ
jgi:peroxiredoxin